MQGSRQRMEVCFQRRRSWSRRWCLIPWSSSSLLFLLRLNPLNLSNPKCRKSSIVRKIAFPLSYRHINDQCYIIELVLFFLLCFKFRLLPIHYLIYDAVLKCIFNDWCFSCFNLLIKLLTSCPCLGLLGFGHRKQRI